MNLSNPGVNYLTASPVDYFKANSKTAAANIEPASENLFGEKALAKHSGLKHEQEGYLVTAVGMLLDKLSARFPLLKNMIQNAGEFLKSPEAKGDHPITSSFIKSLHESRREKAFDLISEFAELKTLEKVQEFMTRNPGATKLLPKYGENILLKLTNSLEHVSKESELNKIFQYMIGLQESIEFLLDLRDSNFDIFFRTVYRGTKSTNDKPYEAFMTRLEGLAAEQKTQFASKIVKVLNDQALHPGIYEYLHMVHGLDDEGNVEHRMDRLIDFLKSNMSNPDKQSLIATIQNKYPTGTKILENVKEELKMNDVWLDGHAKQHSDSKVQELAVRQEAKALKMQEILKKLEA